LVLTGIIFCIDGEGYLNLSSSSLFGAISVDGRLLLWRSSSCIYFCFWFSSSGSSFGQQQENIKLLNQ